MIEVSSGNTLNLDCGLTGQLINRCWSRKYEDGTLESVSSSQSLTLEDIQVKDSGVYTCKTEKQTHNLQILVTGE